MYYEDDYDSYCNNYYEDECGFNNLLNNKDFLIEMKNHFAEPDTVVFYEHIDFQEWAEALEKSSFKDVIDIETITSNEISQLSSKMYTI